MNLRVAARVLPMIVVLVGLAPAAFAQVMGRFDRTLRVDAPISLAVVSGSGRVEVMSGPDGSVRVAGEIRAASWRASNDEIARAVKAVEANPPIQQEGNTVRIGHIPDERIGQLVSVSYTVTVPRQTSVTSKTGSGSQAIDAVAGPVTAVSGSGSVRIGAIEGAVEARTGSGSIQVDRAGAGLSVSSGSGSIKVASVAGNIRARTGSSSIEVGQLTGGTAELSSGSGHIDVGDASGGITASTASASIHLRGTPTADWRATTSSGAITLEIPGDAPFRLQAHTSSGSIRSDHALQTTTVSKRELVGSTGTGGALVDVRSTSGSITIGRR